MPKKLGLKPGRRVRFIDAPDGYRSLLGPLPEDTTIAASTRGRLDFVQLFVRRARVLDERLGGVKRALDRDGMVWICWPKKTSSIETDLDGNRVRAAGLAAGLVDVKVCAIDDDWSGLKFVYRKKDR